jgi:hypothetical protein
MELEEVLEWSCLPPNEIPLSDCFGCTANMCNPFSSTSECRGDQYHWKNGTWKSYTTEYLMNYWRTIKLDEIINEI